MGLRLSFNPLLFNDYFGLSRKYAPSCAPKVSYVRTLADFVGHYFREVVILTIHNIVQINEGSRNLDVITFNAGKNELLVKAYILK